jgi:O-antigen ligase
MKGFGSFVKSVRAGDKAFQKLTFGIASGVAELPQWLKEASLVICGALFLSALVLKSHILALAAIVVLFAFVFLLRQPVWMIYLTVAIIPVAWANLLGHRLRVISFMTVMSLGFYISQALIRRDRLRVEPLYGAIGIYVAICFLSMFNSVDWKFSLVGMKYYLISLAFGLALIFSINSRQRLQVLIVIILAWGVGQSVLSLAQSLISPKFFPAYYLDVFGMDIVKSYSIGGIRRASGTFESGPRLAMFLLLPLSIALTYYFRGVFRRRWLWGLILLALALGIFISFTRIAVLLSAAALMVYYLFERDKGRLVKTAFAVFMLVAVLLILIQILIPVSAYQAMGERFTMEGDQLYLDRFYFLYNALMAFSEHPILGWGVKTYTLHSWDFMQQYPVPWRSVAWDVPSLSMPQGVPVHNDYARMLAETGIFSLLAFAGICFFTFKNLLRAIRKTSDEFVEATAVAVTIFLAIMLAYWFFHEYYMEEPFVSVLPIALSVILRRLAEMDSHDSMLPGRSV